MTILLRQSCKVDKETLRDENLVSQIEVKYAEVFEHGVEFLDMLDQHHYIKKVNKDCWLNPFNKIQYEFLYVHSEKLTH